MALKVGDRVKQTTTTTGTGTITLNGAAPTGFSNFRDYLSDGDTTYYVIEDGTNYEIGLGTFNTGGSATADTIARSSDANVFRSTNSNDRVSWSSGTRSVFISLPSDKAIFRDADGDVVIPDGAFDFDVASHDGTNGLKLGGTLVTSCATELNLLDGVSGLVQADFTKLAAIDSSSGELNLLDGNTSIGTTTISDGHGIVMNHGGTMAQTTVQTLAA